MRLPARYYQLLLPVLQSAGVDIDRLLRRLQLDRARLSDPGCLLHGSQVQRLVEAVLQADTSPDLALRLGRRIKPSSHEMLGLAMMSAATLGQALQLAQQYWPLITPLFGVRPIRTGRAFGLRWTTLQSDTGGAGRLSPEVLRFHAEALLAGMHEELRFLLGELPAGYRIELPAGWLRESVHYRLLRPASIRADAGIEQGFSLWLDASVLETPLLLADAGARRTAEQRCQQLLAQLSAGAGLSDWVRQLLRQAEVPLPSQPQMAGLLRLSGRSLQRHLAAEGLSYRQLLDDERFERACTALRGSQQPVTSIALALGYADASNFARAFSRRAGVAPAAFRRGDRA